jgi:hypothetical protein
MFCFVLYGRECFGWHLPLQQGPHGLRTAGYDWFQITADELQKKLERDREDKKRPAQLRK